MRQGDGVHFIGIDLAWGDKQPTGLAVIDDDARLLHVSAVRTDDEIAAGLAAYVEGDCLAAIDAPIVVTNATGSRPAEQQLSKDFRRYDAGTHPSNTGKPEFANGTRAARVAKTTRSRHRPAVRSAATGHRGLPAPGHDRAVRTAEGPAVQGQTRVETSTCSALSC